MTRPAPVIFLMSMLLACDGGEEKPSTDDTGDDTEEETTPEPEVTWYADADGDGYGNPNDTVDAVEQPSGYVEDATDCDDADAAQNPGAEEVCNREDDDCDKSIDEDAVDIGVWHADEDRDGYGDPDSSIENCEAPKNYIEDSSDCNDGNPTQYPGAPEYCNREDDDCDKSVDEDAVDPSTWYEDYDGDSYGSPDSTLEECDQPVGYVTNSEDCDDADEDIKPGAEDGRDEIDQDCDGSDGYFFSEDFESFSVGDYIGSDSIFFATWTTGSEGTSQDVTVVDELATTSSGKALKFDEDDGDDLVLILGPTSGVWVVSWYMYADTGAYFNLQGTGAPWGDWQAEIYFDETGEAFTSSSGVLTSLEDTIAMQDWVLVEYYVDLDKGTQDLYVDGTLLHSDSFLGTELGGIDFYPTTLSDTQEDSTVFYIDDVVFEEVP